MSNKNNYYSPNLYISNEKYSFVMSAYLTLFDDIDGKLLSDAVEALRERFAYFYVRVKGVDEELRVVDNPLPVPVRNTWEPTVLGSAENNYHLIALRYDGKRLGVEVSHCITDGAGYMPYLRALLFLYLSSKLGKTFNPAGIRLPGTELAPGEVGCPWPEDKFDTVETPTYVPKNVDFYQLGDGPVTMDGKKTNYYLKVSAVELMDFCRQNDGSPNAAVTVLLAKALCKVDPNIKKDIVVGLAINKKALLGNYENYNYGADLARIDFPAGRHIDGLSKACTVVRGQVIAQTMPEDIICNVKAGKEAFAQIDAIPTLKMKMDLLGEALGAPSVSAFVSYTGNRTMGDLDPYIDDFYCVTGAVGAEIVVEINCLNHCFYISVMQNFSSSAYVDELVREFAEEGIGCEVVGTDDLWISGTRYDDID